MKSFHEFPKFFSCFYVRCLSLQRLHKNVRTCLRVRRVGFMQFPSSRKIWSVEERGRAPPGAVVQGAMVWGSVRRGHSMFVSELPVDIQWARRCHRSGER